MSNQSNTIGRAYEYKCIDTLYNEITKIRNVKIEENSTYFAAQECWNLIDDDLKQLYIECLATCHDLTTVKGKIIGDPIDIKMLEGVGWIFRENFENNRNNKTAYDPLVQAYSSL